MKLFLSRDLSDLRDQFLNWVESQDCELIGQSLISFVPEKHDVSGEEYNWVFFTSKQSILHFKGDLANKKIACWGKKTGEFYEQTYHREADFIGEENASDRIARAFKKELQSDKVLFPVSDISLRKIQEQLPVEQTVDVVVYKTKNHPSIIQECDAYLFTSPSNVHAFLEKNTIPNKPVYCLGKSTASTLTQLNFHSVILAKQADIELTIKQIIDDFR